MIPEHYTLLPRSGFAQLLCAFYIDRAAEVLETYGGYVKGPLEDSAVTTSRIRDDFLRNRSREDSAFVRYYAAPYAEVDSYTEVLYYVVTNADLIFQASGLRQVYLQIRADLYRDFCVLVRDLFGFKQPKEREIGDTLVARSQLYAPDSVEGMLNFSRMIQSHVRTNAMTFARVAYGYTLLAHNEVFGALLVYDKSWYGAWSTDCLKCGSQMRTTRLTAPKRFNCSSCGIIFKVGDVYR